MTTSTETASTAVATATELSKRLEQHGIAAADVASIEVLMATDGTPCAELLLFARVTTYARDPLGERYQLLERDAEPRMATEVWMLPLPALLG